jgi:hypothetical protein
MADLKYDILEKFGVLSTSKSGWELQLNFVQWGENTPKFDIRTWAPDNQKMGKGITLTHDEVVKLHDLLGAILAEEGAKPTEPVSAVTHFEEVADSDEDDNDDGPRLMRLSDI